MLCAPVCSAHLYALHTCMLYTPVSSIVLLYLCSCSIFLLILILRLFGLNNKPHTLRQPHSQTLSSPERKTLVGSGHVAPKFLVVTNKINLCVCAIDLMKIKSFPLYIRLNKNKNLTTTGTLILFFLCQNGFSCHLQYIPIISRVRGPYGKLWTEFFPSFYGPSAKRTAHENKEGKNEDP